MSTPTALNNNGCVDILDRIHRLNTERRLFTMAAAGTIYSRYYTGQSVKGLATTCQEYGHTYTMCTQGLPFTVQTEQLT